MAFHTVMIPPLSDAVRSRAEALEQAVFIKDGFHVGAFIFTGFWLLSKRLWLAFIVFLPFWALIALGGPCLGVHPLALAAAQGALGLLLGLEAHTLQERKLLRQGWSVAGVVEGGKRDAYERRFFDAAGGVDTGSSGMGSPGLAAQRMAAVTRPQSGPISAVMMGQAAGPVVGLFPEPPPATPNLPR
jgi:hypothetical protein